MVHAVGPETGAGTITMLPAAHGLPDPALATALLKVTRTVVAGLTPVAPLAGTVAVTLTAAAEAAAPAAAAGEP
jgi:hypothetical protein